MAQFTNQASVSYNGITVNSNIVTGEITQVLSAWKRSTVDEYRTGDILTYVVNIQNSGTSAFTGLSLTDDLGAYTFGTENPVPLTYTGDPVLYTINGVIQTAPAVTAGPPLTISGISVPAGGNSQVIYRARVNDFAALGTGGTINNTATITGGGLTEAITAENTVTANTDAELSIFKELNPTNVVENGPITYTFTIQNTGASEIDSTDSIVLTDTFTPIIDEPLTVTINGTTVTADGNYTYNPATGEFATVAGAITVPAATYTQNSVTGAWSVSPGVTVVTVSGTI